MRRWVPYPFVRFAVFLIAGILIGIYLEGWIMVVLVLCAAAIAFYILFQIFSSKGVHQYFAVPIGICAFFVLCFLGYINVYLSDEKNRPSHLVHFSNQHYQHPDFFRGRIVSPLKEKKKSFGTLVQLEARKVNDSWKKTTGKILVYVKKDSLFSTESLKYGDEILINMAIQRVKGPLNPHTFDYQQFLRYQHIYFQAFVQFQDIHVIAQGGNDIYGLAIQAQNVCAEIIRKNIHNDEAEGIILSLVLGLKDDLEQPIKAAYASAGVMHILAVSGLHVGIFYAILLFILQWLNHGKYKWLFALICLSILWIYALVTGLSPSVLRAVTMFSFIVIAKAFARQYNIYNAIAASAFFLLCYDPFLIMTVGFQLSYIAVLGIVFLYPKFYKTFSFENKLGDAIWKMTCVSLSAQVAVLPLSIYYFHQFPVYFLLANLLVIPAAFAMLVLSICLLVFHVIPGVEWLIANILEFLVVWVNWFVYFINTLPHSIISALYINGWQVVFLFGIIIGVLLFDRFKKFSILAGVAFLFCGFQVVDIVHQWHNNNEKSITYFSTKAAGVVGLCEGNFLRLVITGGDSLEQEEYEYQIKPSLLAKSVDNATFPIRLRDAKLIPKEIFEYGYLLVWNGKKILVIDKEISGSWKLQHELKTDLLILEKNAVDKLTALPANLIFDVVIIGNSYSHKVANGLKKHLKEGVELYFPKDEGAFTVSW